MVQIKRRDSRTQRGQVRETQHGNIMSHTASRGEQTHVTENLSPLLPFLVMQQFCCVLSFFGLRLQHWPGLDGGGFEEITAENPGSAPPQPAIQYSPFSFQFPGFSFPVRSFFCAHSLCFHFLLNPKRDSLSSADQQEAGQRSEHPDRSAVGGLVEMKRRSSPAMLLLLAVWER